MEVRRKGIDGVGDYDDDDDDDDNVNRNGHVLKHVQVEFHKTLLPFRLAQLIRHRV